MTTKSLIFLTLLSLSNASSLRTRLGKCCPPGKIFSGAPVVDCVPAPSSAVELYSVDYGGVPAQQDGFPICEKPEDVSMARLSELNSSDFLQVPSCLEILHEETTNQSVPIVVFCRSNRDRDEKTTESTASLPRLLNVTRCCPKNMVYSKRAKTCLTAFEIGRDGNSSEIDEFLSLLPKELDGIFLGVTRGPPSNCTEAIFNYEIPVDRIEFVNGTLQAILPSSTGDKHGDRFTINRENTCLELSPDSLTKRQLVVRVCKSPDLCQDNSCIRKCCPEDKFYLFGSGCVSYQSGLVESPLDFYEAFSNVTNNTWANKDFGVFVGSPCKHGRYILNESEKWRVTSKGFIEANGYNPSKYNMYCMEVIYNASKWLKGLQPMFCFENPEENIEYGVVRYIITSILETTSCIFLLLTLMVYACLPVLQNLHGKTLMCHAASLMMGYACLALVPWVTPNAFYWEYSHKGSNDTMFCSVLGYIMLFAFLSAFCWLNVMCFDIWRTFGRLRGNISRGKAHSGRFLLYSAYAWGLPIFITAFGTVSDKTWLLPVSLRPNIGTTSCWFSQFPQMYGQLVFFVVPITIQLIANVVFFILTSVHCSKVKAEIRRVADPSDPRSKRFHADKTKFIMNVKLFVVMGISWIAEIVSFLLNKYSTNLYWQEEVFYASDVLNCLQGLLIFILFVMKPRVYQALKKRLGFESKKKSASQGSSTLQDPLRVKKSASSSTLTSSYAVSSVP